MKKTLSLLTLLAFTFMLNAQTVPGDAVVAAALDIGSLNKKLDTKFKLELDTAYDVLTKPETIVLNAVKSPRQMGLDMKRKSLIYVQPVNDGDDFDQVVVLPIANIKLFEQVVIARLEASSKAKRNERDGHKYFNYHHTNVIYNDEVAIFQRTDNYSTVEQRLYNSQYFYEYNEVIKEINRERIGLKPGTKVGDEAKVKETLSVIQQNGEGQHNHNYRCPMLCEGNKTYAEAGKCPVCEMELTTEPVDIEIEAAEEVTEAPAEEVVEEVMDVEADESTEDYYNEYQLRQKKVGYDYDNHPLMVAFKANWEDRNRQRIIDQNVKYEIENFKKNLAHLENNTDMPAGVKEVVNSDQDVSFWYAATTANMLMSNAVGPTFMYRYRRMVRGIPDEDLQKALEGNYVMGGLNFSGDEVELKMVNHLSDKFKNYNAMVDQPVNSKFQYYLPKGTHAIYSANVDPEKLWKTYMDVITYSIESEANEPWEQSQLLAFDMLDIFINKDMIYNTFAGDMLYAMPAYRTEVTETPRTRWNQETYEREEYIDKDTTVKVDFIAMATIKNKDQLMLLVNAFEKRGLLVKRGPGVYQNLEPKYNRESEEGDFYLGIKEDVMIWTNHQKIALEYMQNGIPKGMRMSAEEMAPLREKGTNFILNPSFFTIPVTEGDYRRSNRFGPIPFDNFSEMSNIVRGMTMHSETNGSNEVESTFTLQLNEEVNVLQELIQSLKEN